MDYRAYGLGRKSTEALVKAVMNLVKQIEHLERRLECVEDCEDGLCVDICYEKASG